MKENTTRFIFSDAPGIRGVGAFLTIRLTRQSDAASILLHAIDPALEPQMGTAVFEPGPPDFTHPFVTRITGMIKDRGMLFLIEPLPPAVPLLDVWAQVLRDDPQNAVPVLRVLTGQLGKALEQLHATGQRHGAVAVENVVLTTAGIYGLLVARLPSAHDWLWLRPLRHRTSSADRRNDRTWHPQIRESVERVVVELANVAATTNVLSRPQRSELEALWEQEVSRTFNYDNQTLIR